MSISCYVGWYVVVFGTASVQRYVFQSNRLKENIGASYLVEYWLGDGLVEVTQADATSWNTYVEDPLRDLLENPIDKNKSINVIYIGGGNAALLCKSKSIAEKAIETWSREVLKNAPGLRVVVGYSQISSCKSLAKTYRDALDDLNLCEEALPFGTTLYSLPVVRACISTGIPASETRRGEDNQDNQDEWISKFAVSKRDAVGTEKNPGRAQRHIAEKFPAVLEKTEHLPGFSRFAIGLDEELGGRKGESHVAVVHADGNGMGDKLNRVIDKTDQGDAKFLHNLRAFSASTTNLSHKALNGTLLHLKRFLPQDPLENPEDVFPLRPIVYGGDDLTFVCDGRIGLHLAAFYLREFSTCGKIRVCGQDESVDACAGVAIVPTKFPFDRAYGFADELCRNAKLHRRYKNASKGNWLDFQIFQEGATRSIKGLRETQYRTLARGRQRLDQRPYEVLVETAEKPQGWDLFVEILKTFQSRQWPRSRAKGLLEALVQGPASTKAFVQNARWSNIELPPPEPETGWAEPDEKTATTSYFDPLEALDFYLKEFLSDCDTIKDEE